MLSTFSLEDPDGLFVSLVCGKSKEDGLIVDNPSHTSRGESCTLLYVLHSSLL